MKRNFLDELLVLLGNDPEKYMIEHSLFFSKDVVDRAFDEMEKNLQAGRPIIVRKSTKKDKVKPYRDVAGTLYWNNIYQNNSLDNIVVKEDKDGNKEVRRLINKITRTKVSQGATSDILFAKISHIWAETSNPFFFTSLWNIVIVPAYFNDILDKDGSSDPRIDMIIEQFKAVCWDKYDIQGKLSNYEPKHKVAYSYNYQEIPSSSSTYPPGVKKVGEIAKNDLMNVLSTSSKVTNGEIIDLQTLNKSYAVFGINYPLLDVALLTDNAIMQRQ